MKQQSWCRLGWSAALVVALLPACKKSSPALQMRGQAPAFYQSGLVHLRRGENQLALQDLQRAAALDGSKAIYFNALGLAHYAGNDLTHAIAAYREALRLDPKFSDAHNNLGSAYSTLGDYAQAKEQFNAALADPNYSGAAAAHYNLGLIAQEAGDLAGAEHEYARALERDSRFYDAAIRHGEVLEKLSRLPAAIASYQLALLVQPDNLELTYKLAQLLYATGQRDESVRFARSIVQIAPGSAVALKAVKLLQLMHK